MPRRQLHQVVFLLAGLYNIAWGVFSVVDPHWLGRYSGTSLQFYPNVVACVGMVLALYGLLYLEVARRPEAGRLIVAIGLSGKVLAPLAWMRLSAIGGSPTATLLLCFVNDVVWWIPFVLYLHDARQMDEIATPTGAAGGVGRL